MDDLFVFHRFMEGDDENLVARCHKAAIDKLQTLYPDKRLTMFDYLTIGIETDSYYSDTGTDTYELGLVDHEIPAIRNVRNNEILTFRI